MTAPLLTNTVPDVAGYYVAQRIYNPPNKPEVVFLTYMDGQPLLFSCPCNAPRVWRGDPSTWLWGKMVLTADGQLP